MDGKRFVFDLQRFTEVTITETSTGSGKYKVDDSSTEYDSLDKAINAANVKFSVTTSNETKYYDAADDFNKNNNLNEATGVNIYGDVTLQANATVELGNDKNNVIKVAKNATLNLGSYTLTIKRTGTINLSESSYTSPVSAIVVKNGVTFNVEGTTTTDANGNITGGTIKYDWDPSSSDTLGTIKQGRTSAAVQVGEKVGKYQDNLSSTAKATFNMKSGIITSKSTAISMSDNGVVNISGGKTESEKSCGIYYGNSSPGGGKINISGGLLQSGSSSKLPAIQVSGSVGEREENPGAEITISGGTVAFTNNGYDPTATSTDYFKSTGKPIGNPDAIYAGGKTKLTISGGNITSTGTGVELRAGSLDFTGGSVTSKATTYKAKAANNTDTSGGQTFGAAIAVTQHTTNQSLTVNISGENTKASGAVALTIENTTDSKDTESSIAATISGGTLESTDAAAIAAKAADSRSSITIDGDVTFVGQLETTFAETSSGDGKTTGITITPKATVTIQEKVVDDDGNVTYKTVETFDSSSLKFNIGNSSNSNYVVVNEGWNSYNSVYKPAEENASQTANSFIYLTKKTGDAAASLIVTLAPKKVTATNEGESQTDSTEILALTTGLTDQESYDKVIALDLNDTLFSSLFGETSNFKTLDASAITQVGTDTKKTDQLKLNITGNKNITSILGSKGNDTLTAGANGASLNGDDGDDLLIGSSDTSKSDTFIYTAGADSIQGYSTVDVVSLGSGLTAPTSFDNVNYTGSDYIVSLGGNAGDSLTFKATNAFSLTNGTNTYHYTTTSIAKGDTEITLGPDHSNKFDASDTNYQTINGSAVTNAIRITGNDKGDYIIGAKAGGTLIGGAKNDTLQATDGGTTLNGGDGADSLVGGNGADVFVYTGGADSISGYGTNDLVSVRGFNPANATFSVGDNISLDFGGTDKLIFEGVSDSSAVSVKSGRTTYRYTKDYVATDDGITLASGYNTPFNGAATENANYTTIDGSAVSTSISITGNDKGNYIVGSTVQGSSLYGGADDDTLVGGTGADVFHYTAGNDVIQNFGSNDKLDIDTTAITKARSSSSRLTFTTTEKGTLTFRSDDSAPTKVALAGENAGYLTADGVVSSNSLKLFSSAKGKIDLKDDSLYSDITTVVADSVKSQSVTLVGGTQGGSFTFVEGGNKKRDGFEYGGGNVTITNYEAGKDRINLGAASISGFAIANTNDVSISVSNGTTNGVISLQGAKGSEVLLHQSTSKGNSYQKMVFDESGVMYDKKKATSATLSTGANNFDASSSTVPSTLKKITLGEGVQSINVTAGDKNTVIDASLAGAGISLTSGSKNDKFIGSANADVFVYTAGKDIIQDFVATGEAADQISLNGSSNDVALSSAKITAGKKSVKFKFGNKDVLTVKPTKGSTLSSSLTVNENPYTFGKNSIAEGTNVSLTSQFGGTYNIEKINKNASSSYNYVDGHLVEKKLTFKGTTAAESLIGGDSSSSKTLFKGGGGADSLVGGAGADTFFYAKGDKDTVTIANFDFSKDKLKIAGGTISKIASLGSSVQFAMKEGKGKDAAAVGWFNVASSIAAGGSGTADTIDASKVAIKANNTYYWFAKEDITEQVTVGGESSTVTIDAGELITWSDKKVSKSDVSDYSVIELKYATNLVKSGVATAVSSTLTGATPTKTNS